MLSYYGPKTYANVNGILSLWTPKEELYLYGFGIKGEKYIYITDISEYYIWEILIYQVKLP